MSLLPLQLLRRELSQTLLAWPVQVVYHLPVEVAQGAELQEGNPKGVPLHSFPLGPRTFEFPRKTMNRQTRVTFA